MGVNLTSLTLKEEVHPSNSSDKAMDVRKAQYNTKVRVKYLATLKPLAKKPEDEITITGEGTLLDLLKEIKQRGSEALIKRLFDPSSCYPQPDIVILVNGFEISALNGLSTKLKDGDTVIFLPSVHGG